MRYYIKDIIVCKNYLLGTNSVILEETKLGNSVTIAEGSVVDKEFPSKIVIGRIPSKAIKKLI